MLVFGCVTHRDTLSWDAKIEKAGSCLTHQAIRPIKRRLEDYSVNVDTSYTLPDIRVPGCIWD